MSDREYIVTDGSIGYPNNSYNDNRLSELYYRRAVTSNLGEEIVNLNVSALNELKEQFKELKEENKRLRIKLETVMAKVENIVLWEQV